jgi:NitT/TauT family transport system substrate-binding protein
MVHMQMRAKMTLVGAAVGALWAFGTPQAHALETVKVTQAVASFSFLPADYAKAAGYFKKEGLNVQQIATRGGGPDMAALVSGNVTFNFGVGVYEINALIQNQPLVNVLNMEDRPSISVVLSRAAVAKTGLKPSASLAQRAAALKGLKIGITRPGSLTDKEIRHLAKIGGLKKGDIKIVAIGRPQSMIAALKLGQIDGFSISIPYDRLAVDKSLAVEWINNPAGQDNSVDPFMMSSLVTTPQMVKQHPDLIRKMVKALRHAMQDIITKPVPAIRSVIAHEYSKIDTHTLDVSIAAAKKLMNPTGKVTLQMAQNTVAFDGRGASAQALFKTFDSQFLK